MDSRTVDGGYRIDTIATGAMDSCPRPIRGGVHDETAGATFVCWLGEQAVAHVRSYDHAADAWSDPRAVGTLSPDVDYHHYPVIVQSADRRLHLFYGCHGHPLKQTTSPEPASIEGEWNDRAVEAASRATYPIPFSTGDGDLYVFYRQRLTATDKPLQYVRSTDDGRTWVSSNELAGTERVIGHERPDGMNGIYVGDVARQPAAGDTPERLHLVWTISEGSGYNHMNLYYAAFEPTTGTFAAADGAKLGPRIGRTESETACTVLDAGDSSGDSDEFDAAGVGFVSPVHYTDDGHPVVAFVTDGYTRNRTATWDGSEWQFTADAYAGRLVDLEKTGARSFRLYTELDAHTDDPDGTDLDGAVLVYASDDAGRHWRRIDRFGTPGGSLGASQGVIEDYRDPVRLWLGEDVRQRDDDTGTVYVAGREPAGRAATGNGNR